MTAMALVEPASDPAEFDRTPPQDIGAEQSVLGGMLLSRDAVGEVADVITGRDFYRPAHELLFDVILDMYSRGEPIDAITVAAELTERGDLAHAGGYPYLHELVSTVPTAANASYYAGTVKDRAIRRRVIAAGTRIVQVGYATDGGDTDAIVNAVQAEAYAVTDTTRSEDYVLVSTVTDAVLDSVEAAAKRGGALTGVPTGFADLDKLTGGLQPGQLILIAGRPSLGKTTVALDVIRSASVHHGMCSVMFSLEMSRAEVTQKLLAAESSVPLQSMKTGAMREADWTRLASAQGRVNEAALFIDDSPSIGIPQIRAKARRLKLRHNLRLIVVDYLQLMSSGKRVESRQQEVSEFSRALKLLAKELEVPVIALSQLNRGPEQRTDKKPMMSDLRESGSLEQDSDTVILIHREDFYDKESPRAGEADLIVAKHRAGPTDTVTVAFQGHYSRFVDMASDYDRTREPGVTS